MDGSTAHLQGDLTHSGVTQNIITSLAVSLQKMESAVEKNIRIDCAKVKSADISGLQLLYVWMQCARFRGVGTELVNLSKALKKDMQKIGLRHCFIGNCANS
jgi:ABC-type transporter Mla MlaB component